MARTIECSGTMCMFVQWRRRLCASGFRCSTMALPSGHAGGPEAAQGLRLVTVKGGVYNPPWLGPSAEEVTELSQSRLA